MEENDDNSKKSPVTEITNQCDLVTDSVNIIDDSKKKEDEVLIGVTTAEDFVIRAEEFEGRSSGKEEAVVTTEEEERETTSPIGGREIELEGGGEEAVSREVKESETEVVETEELERKIELSGEIEVNDVCKDVIETEIEDDKKDESEAKDVCEAGRDDKEDESEPMAACVDAEAETKDELEIEDACEAVNEGEAKEDLEEQKESESKAVSEVVFESKGKDDLGTESVLIAECETVIEESCKVDCKMESGAEVLGEASNVVEAEGESGTETKLISDKEEVEEKLELGVGVRESQNEAEEIAAQVNLEHSTDLHSVAEDTAMEDNKLAMENESRGKNDDMEDVPDFCDEDDDTEMEREAEENAEGAAFDSQLDDSQLAEEEEDDRMVGDEEIPAADIEMETETDAGDSVKVSGEKRKRGRNPKTAAKAHLPNMGLPVEEEDVCFVCFDGGDLVLCDRKNCPKAYHPYCVNRDEKFFQAKGRWNCGWHQCSHTNCQKNAYYMCYTCTFSLCKGCIKDAVILCVRGNKGFCEACMKIVTMIEDSQQGNQVQIDFDDKSSWEYLFKDYWIDLKEKLSISSDEISQAKNPWKGSDVVAGTSGEQLDMKDDGGFGSDNASDNPEASKPKKRKGKKRLKSRAKQDELTSEAVAAGAVGTSTPKSTEWASKELLEFVMHMKDGDTTMLSQFDVQALLLEYIKQNKLRDPRRKSQIICDVRLQNIFGKARVGHFEMLKLLESHFLTREDTQVDDVQGSVVDTETNHLDAEGNTESLTKSGKDRKRKIRKKNGRGRQSNLDDYAAIDIHNISLIYLRRKLMEDLLEDIETFNDKVVGTFVRIRISGSNPKQDTYRLVQVTGTSKVDELYKVGKRTTNLMLEILNLDKTEVISIDSISNQDFTEDECKRLRQIIKFGVINRLSVGEILDKAMEVQVARVNDWLESEVVRLTHLRDRASDLGKKKQLRECVESLQILKTPEERRRRLEDIPQIHADPKMDPTFESEDNDSENDSNKQELYTRSRSSSFSRRGREPISPGSGDIKDSWGSNKKTSGEGWESNRNLSNKNLANKVEDASHGITISGGNSWNHGRGSEIEPYKLEKPTSAPSPGAFGLHSVTRSDSFSQVQSQKSAGPLTAPVATAAVNISETEKMWYYEDPHGKVQGPFSMVQLRKWSNTGYFPADLRIWRNSGNKDDSLLLTDALAGKFQKEVSLAENGNPKGNTLQSPHLQSTHNGKLHESSSLKGREVLDAEMLNSSQNHVTMHINSASRNWDAPSGDSPVLSADRTNSNYGNRINSVNLPSPTPRHSSAREVGPLTASVSLPGSIDVLQSPAAATATPDSARNSTLGSHSGFGVSPKPEQSILVDSTNSLQTSQSPATVLSHGVLIQGHPFTASESNANVVQSMASQNPALGTHGWNSTSTQSMEVNSSTQTAPQQPNFAQWGGVPSVPVQNPATNFPMQGVSSMQPPNPWMPPIPSNQSNVQWSVGVAENSTPAQNVQHDNPIPGWGSMQQVIPNMGWTGPNPNMNWMASVQGPQPGSINPGWAMQAANPGAGFQGVVPGNLNPGWVATPQMLGPMNANQSWFPTGNMAQNAQGPVPGNGNTGLTAPTGNLGPPSVQQNQMPGNANSGWSAPPSGNANQGWAPPAGNQGNHISDHHRDGDRFSGQNDQGSQRGRSWNKQSSSGGGGSRNGPRGICYQFQDTGHCRRGSSCGFRHVS